MRSDGDLAFLNEFNKQLRANRITHFQKNWLHKFKSYFVEDYTFEWVEKMYCYRLTQGVPIFDFYPKANKVFLYSRSRWIKPGLQWMIKTYLKHGTLS